MTASESTTSGAAAATRRAVAPPHETRPRDSSERPSPSSGALVAVDMESSLGLTTRGSYDDVVAEPSEGQDSAGHL